MEKIFDDDWEKTMTVLERDALTIARHIIGSIKTDSIFAHVENDARRLSGEVINFLHCYPIDEDKLSQDEKEIWASTLLSEAARSVQTWTDTRNTKKIQPGTRIWHGWGVISPKGRTIAAISTSKKSARLAMRHYHSKDFKLIRVEAILIHTKRSKTL